MEKPLISICIPTYNRADFLRECLESIVTQFEDKALMNKVEVVILDNISQDKTSDVVGVFSDKYKNIRYCVDTEKRGIAGGQIKVGTLANGDYIWFFSDDDKHNTNSLSAVIGAIEKYKSDVIFCNTSTFIDDKIISTNNFGVNKNLFLKDKKDLFDFINNHYYCNDFFFTFLSDYIIKRDIFINGLFIIEKYNSPLDLYPFHLPIYYTNSDFSFVIIASPIVMYRGDNVSWGPSDKIKHEFFTEQLVINHYNNILTFNKQYMSFGLVAKMKFYRIKRRIILKIISNRNNKIINNLYLLLRFCKKKLS